MFLIEKSCFSTFFDDQIGFSMLQITDCDLFGSELFHSIMFRASMRDQSTRGALRVIPRGKQRLTVYRALQVSHK